ncbi:hypothetical protein PC123_g22543 [Phytophthora cactorum]|nr:hypothetical protein PC123_g22543 [Phytophthora cactorum]
MVDVHNFLAKLKRQAKAGTTLSDRVSETLDRFSKEEEFGVAHADINRQGDKTWHMRFLVSAFPETLLADATHDTNASRYKLCFFMVQDSLEKGQHIQVRRHVLCLKGTIPVSHNLHNLRHNLYKISHNFHNYGHNPYNLSHNLKKKIPGEDSTSSCTPKRNEEVNVTRKHALESILLKSSLVATMWKERGSDHNAKRLKGPGYGALAKL